MIPKQLLENDEHNFSFSGDAAWLGQTAVSNDGVDAFESQSIYRNQKSCFETNVNGPATVNFQWKVSSVPNFHYLRFYIDNVRKTQISGDINWLQESFILPANQGYLLKWCYQKSFAANSYYADKGWVDQLQIDGGQALGAQIVLDNTDYTFSDSAANNADWFGQTGTTYDNEDAFRSGEINNNQKTCFETAINGAAQISFYMKLSALEGYGYFRFYVDGRTVIELDGNTDWRRLEYLVGSGGSHTLKWCYEKEGFPSYTPGLLSRAWVDELSIVPYQSVSLSSALELHAASIVTLSGDLDWYGQTGVTRDGFDALEIGALAGGEEACFETSASGPKLLSFYWKLSSYSAPDAKLTFYIDGVEEASIIENVDWTRKAYIVEGSGSYTLKWCYEKQAGNSQAPDKAWVDELSMPTFVPIGPAIALESNQVLSFSGDANWFGQSEITYDGEDALQSGSISNGQESCFASAVTGPVSFSFYWKFSSAANQGRLTFSIDGNEQVSLPDEQSWRQEVYALNESRAYNLQWCHRRDSASFYSRAWVDQMEIAYLTPIDPRTALDIGSNTALTLSGDANWFGQDAVLSNNPDALQSGAIADNEQSCFEVAVDGSSSITFLWKLSSEQGADYLNFYVDGVPRAEISGERDWAILDYIISEAGSHALKWCYEKNASGQAGQDRAWVDRLRIRAFSPSVTLADALDDNMQNFTLSGDANWFGQELITSDGTDAVQSGPIAINQSSCFSTTLSLNQGEELTLDFDWKIDAHSSNKLIFYLDNTELGSINAKRNWRSFRGFAEGAGQHTLQWCYEKSAASDGDMDSAWVDSLRFSLLNKQANQEADLEDALDNATLDYSLSGSLSWFRQTITTSDGMDALQSGSVVEDQNSCFGTVIPAASTRRIFSFYWKTSSKYHPGFAALRFYMNNTVNDDDQIGGETNWTQRSYIIESGRSYNVRWCYEGDDIDGDLYDIDDDFRNIGTAWVDQISLAPYAFDAKDALDFANSSQSLLFSGNADWLGQSSVTSDSVDALQSGSIGHNQISCAETEVDGSTDISFYWRTSSEDDYDFLRFYINGIFVSQISGLRDWSQYSYSIIASGRHTLRWCYEKDFDYSYYQDRAWIDQFVIVPH